MNEQHKYRATDKMSDLICDNYSLLMVMSRFGLSLGFGDKSVKDVCEAQHVDYRTFLAVANFISEEQYSYSADNDSFSIPALMDYLKRAHAYFLDFNLPAMRRKLIEAIDCSRDNDVAYLILKFFDEYAKEVRRHMEYENKAVFTYVEQLLQGRPSDVYNIATFASKHNQIDTKLTELKNIIIKYYPEKENNNLLNAVLFDIFNCEQDLASHCQVEDYMFVPAVAQIEKRLKDEQYYFSENSCCRNFGHCTKWSCGSAQTHSQSECAPHRGVVTGSIAELYTSAHSRYCNRKPYFRRLVRPALFQDKP